jgi:AraC-like DNA-binding protein/mannose-6-phosphate isomerase-like protein (cupin superfamily)
MQTTSRKFIDPDAQARPVFILSDRHESISVPWHSHRRAQLIHVSQGVLTVRTRDLRFVIPPQRAVWIGAGVLHRIEGRSPFWLTTCYIEPELLTMSAEPRVVTIDRLVDELLIEASKFGGDYPEEGPEERLITVLLDRLQGLAVTDIALPEVKDHRLQRICKRLTDNPSLDATLVMLAAEAALTERTAARLFVRDTGMTFGKWRQHMRLQRALEHLSAGNSVTQTAFDVGYSDVSSFIAAFKNLFGRTPTHILDQS